MKTGIYAITNSANGKSYVGSAVNFRKRRSSHWARLRRGAHHSLPLQMAWNKYGEDAFTFRPLLICAREHLLAYEQLCIDALDSVKSGYNVLPKAGSRLGAKHSPETKALLSQQKRGVKRPPFTAEHKALMSVAHIGKQYCLGYKHSEEARANMRSRIVTSEHRAAVSAGLAGNSNARGFKHTAETREKVAAASRGNTNMLGKTLGEATRAKISAAHRGRPKSPEQRAKMAESARLAWAKRKGG